MRMLTKHFLVQKKNPLTSQGPGNGNRQYKDIQPQEN